MSRSAAPLLALLALAAPLAAPRTARAEGPETYGGFSLLGTLEPLGSGTDLDRRCADLGAASCSTPVPLGAGLEAYVGWARAPFALELVLSGFGDYQRPAARFDGSPHAPHVDPLLSTPARDETFVIVRGGGALAVRGRYSWSRPRWEPSVAAGVGLAYRYMALEREATSDAGLEDRPYFPTGTHYVSPTLSLEAQLLYRLEQKAGIVFGLALSAESAGSDTRAAADPTRALAGNGQVAPIATPPYEMAHGLQLFVVPYVGVQLGR